MTYHRTTSDFTQTDAIQLVSICLTTTANRAHQQTISEQAYHYFRHPTLAQKRTRKAR